jgi:hypothetical protein
MRQKARVKPIQSPTCLLVGSRDLMLRRGRVGVRVAVSVVEEKIDGGAVLTTVVPSAMLLQDISQAVHRNTLSMVGADTYFSSSMGNCLGAAILRAGCAGLKVMGVDGRDGITWSGSKAVFFGAYIAFVQKQPCAQLS